MANRRPTPPTQPSFVGEHVYLRPMTPEDVLQTHHWTIQEEPQSHTSHPQTILTAAAAAEAFRKIEHSPDCAYLMIVRNADNVQVGRIRYFNWNNLNRSAELEILIDPDERRRGHAQESLRILMRYLFRLRNLNKVYIQFPAPSEGAIRLLEGLGFVRDGVLRRHYFHDGEFLDGFLYSRLASELQQGPPPGPSWIVRLWRYLRNFFRR